MSTIDVEAVSASSTIVRLITEELDRLDDGWTTADLTETILGRLEPGVMEAYARECARGLIGQLARSTMARDRRRARRRAFAAALSDATEAGDVEGRRSAFDAFFTVSADGMKKRLGSMTAADLRFVAGSYRSSAKKATMLAAVYTALEKKIVAAGAETVEEVIDEEEYLTIIREYTGD